VLAAHATCLAAQGTGTAAIALLGLSASARMAALGGAYAGVAGDEGNVFVNPAGMAPVRPMAASASWEQGLPGEQLATLALAARRGRLSLGLGAMALHLGGDSAVVPAAALGGGSMAAGGYAAMGVAALAYRHGLISLGGSVKYVRQVADSGSGGPGSHATGIAGDVGATVAIFDIMALGVTLQNIGGPVTATDGGRLPLPRVVRVGSTLNFVEPQGTFRLMTHTELLAPARGDAYWVFGVESGVVVSGFGMLARASYAAGHEGSDRRPAAFGAEVRLRSLRAEYAFQAYRAPYRAAHSFGVRFYP